jgi:hypothetical protein
MVSWLTRMVSSSGKSSLSRRAICSGLQAVAHRRSCRRPARRPFQGTLGPRISLPFGATTRPASRSCTYSRSAALMASSADFGRRADRSACHCAVVARYSKPPPRVAALRRSSREIVEGCPLEPAGDLPHAVPPCTKKRDLFPLDERQVPTRRRLRQGRKMRWWLAAGLPEPPGSHGRRYSGIHRGVLARVPCRDRRPERPPVFAPRHGRPMLSHGVV